MNEKLGGGCRGRLPMPTSELAQRKAAVGCWHLPPLLQFIEPMLYSIPWQKNVFGVLDLFPPVIVPILRL